MREPRSVCQIAFEQVRKRGALDGRTTGRLPDDAGCVNRGDVEVADLKVQARKKAIIQQQQLLYFGVRACASHRALRDMHERW